MAEFDNRELPKWEGERCAALPNYDALPADCAGAIISRSIPADTVVSGVGVKQWQRQTGQPEGGDK